MNEIHAGFHSAPPTYRSHRHTRHTPEHQRCTTTTRTPIVKSSSLHPQRCQHTTVDNQRPNSSQHGQHHGSPDLQMSPNNRSKKHGQRPQKQQQQHEHHNTPINPINHTSTQPTPTPQLGAANNNNINTHTHNEDYTSHPLLQRRQ